MGSCLSKKKGSSTNSASTAATQGVPELKNCGNGVIVSKPKVDETGPQVKLKKENNDKKKTVEEKQHEESYEGQVKKEIFIIKHRKSHDHDNRDGNSKCLHGTAQQNAPQLAETMGEKIAPNMGVLGVRTSSCTKEEVDAILIQCGRLSRNSSGKAAAAASGEHGKRRYSGSKRSYDFDNCDNNDTISTDEDKKKTNDSSDLCEGDGMVVAAEKHHQHRQRHRQSPRPSSPQGRRRTPSREREQQQRSSSRERRVSRSPGRRSSETTTPANATTANASSSSRPGKMVSVPATISSMVMDNKSNNGGGGGGEFATTTSIKRITVKRNVGAASPRSQSPARANGNVANADKVLSENQQKPSLSRNSSRKAEQSPCRRNPLSEVDHNTLAYPQSAANNNSSRVQNKPKKEIEIQPYKKPNVDMNDNGKNLTSSRVELDKGVSANCKTKMQQEEDVKVQSSMTDNVVVMTVIPPGVDNLKPQTLTRSRSSRRSRDLDHNPEALFNPPQSYTSLLLQDIQNFHQKNTPSVSLPACVTKACSIVEAVADLNSTTRSNFSGTYQSSRNDYNVLLGTNQYGKRVSDTKDPFVESEVVVSDDLMEPSLHKYVTVKRGGSLGGVDTMEDQESSGSNSFTVSSSQQQHLSNSSSWEPNSADSKDCWTSRLNYSKEESQKSPLRLGREGVIEARCDVDEAMKKVNSKR